MRKSILSFALGLMAATAIPALCQSVLTYEHGFLEKAEVVGAGSLSNGVAQASGTLTLTGARFASYAVKGASFTAAASGAYQAASLSAGITMTLPDATTCVGQEVYLFNNDSTSSVTPATVHSQTIAGTTPAAVTHGNKATYLSDGSNWQLL